MVTFFSGWDWTHALAHARPAAVKNTSNRRDTIGSPLEFEDLPGVALEDHLFVGRGQALQALYDVARLVQPTPGLRVLDRADAGPLGTEQAAVCANRLEEQLECVLRVQDRVVVHAAHPVREAFDAPSDRTRFESGVLIGNGPASVRDDDLQ